MLQPTWQGVQFGNLTFDKETECDIEAIRDLIDSPPYSPQPYDTSANKSEVDKNA